jgi:hypothetical protein
VAQVVEHLQHWALSSKKHSTTKKRERERERERERKKEERKKIENKPGASGSHL